jgi:hypothetical protein
MKQMIQRFQKTHISNQILVSVVGILAYLASSAWLESNYLRSKFPVSYFIGQTSFSAEKVKTWYQFMISHNTFDIYVQTQFIDFIFIGAVMLMGFSIWTLVANLHPSMSFFGRVGYRLAFALPMAGLFDILENLVSFFMLNDPSDFSSWLAFPYSLFASLKFGCWCIALIWLFASVAFLLIRILINFLTRVPAMRSGR